jgi:hypothetical protein
VTFVTETGVELVLVSFTAPASYGPFVPMKVVFGDAINGVGKLGEEVLKLSA